MSFEEFLAALGHLHDCRLTQLRVDIEAGSIEFSIEDIHANFAGLPDYPGTSPGVIVLTGVRSVSAELPNILQGANIYEINTRQITKEDREIEVRFWPSGNLHAIYRRAHFPPMN